MRSGIILAGGRSSRMGGEKGLTLLQGKPLVAHVAEKLARAVDEVIIVVASKEQIESYCFPGASVVVDKMRGGTPLVGAYSGFTEASGEYAFLTGGDHPLLDPRVLELIFSEAEGHDAATPSWPNGWVEPLHAAYRVKTSAKVASRLLERGEKRLGSILRALHDVKLIPLDEVRQVDPDLLSLIDVDTPEELERVQFLLEDKN